MEDNFKINADTTQQPLITETIIAQKIYGLCRQQDCLKPIDSTDTPPTTQYQQISSSLLGEANSISGSALTGTINPNSIISFNNTVASINVTDFKLSKIQVSKIEPNVFSSNGYWNITITYVFSYILNLLDSAGSPISVTLNTSPTTTPITDINAYTTYEKNISLFGGGNGSSNSEVLLANTLYNPTGTYISSNEPYIEVQAIANLLSYEIGTYVINTTTQYQADLTIGLFTIIKAFRLVNLQLEGNINNDIPLCDSIATTDPCEYFNEIPFPYDQFTPPQNNE